MKVEDFIGRVQPRRKLEGISAALLPFDNEGRIAIDAFQCNLQATYRAGLKVAVNMDTGYVNLLTEEEKVNVLVWTREALGDGVPFVAGAYIEGLEGDLVSLYRREVDRIIDLGGTPILFQTSRLNRRTPREKVETYATVCKGYDEVLGFELSPVFAPNGEILDEECFMGLMGIEELKGLKHSSLNRQTELRRIALRDSSRPEFRIYTGNDLGINMIEYGSDYLLGLAAFAPEKFAERDRRWETGDPAYYELSDALQHLGNVAFRPPVPAYKHSAAIVLHLLGRIPSPHTHPMSPRRPEWEAELLGDCLLRLGYA